MLTADEWEAVRLSLKVASVATLFMMPVAFALAYVLARKRFPGRTLVDALVHLPLVLPPVVTGYVLLVLFGGNGAIGAFLERTLGLVFAFRWTGAALASGIMAMPLMVRAMRLSIEAVDTRLEAAARTLGAGRARTFLSILVPLSLPGIIAGAVLGFAKSMGEFGATITFVANIPGETRTLPVAIYTQLQIPGGELAVARLSLVAVVISMGALLLSEWLARRSQLGRSGHVL